MSEKISEKDKVLVVQVGRSIVQDVEFFIGRKVDAIISVERVITTLEMQKLAVQANNEIMKLARGGNVVHIFFSVPCALAFLIGQILGLDKAKVIVWQFTNGQYMPVSPVARELFFRT
jgi:hypothetical protein